MNKDGFIVRLADGQEGRTLHANGLINNKVLVYLKVEKGYSRSAILCSLSSIIIVGCID